MRGTSGGVVREGWVRREMRRGGGGGRGGCARIGEQSGERGEQKVGEKVAGVRSPDKRRKGEDLGVER